MPITSRDEEAGSFDQTSPLLLGLSKSLSSARSGANVPDKYGSSSDDVTVSTSDASSGDSKRTVKSGKSSKNATNLSKSDCCFFLFAHTLFLLLGPIYYVIYALVNSIMCIPCLYGYAAVIFNNDAFSPHINALSKLVLWSSAIHQFSFCIFSSLPFSIGQVQDAGLIFLSHMANTIANNISDQGGTNEEILSTTLVLLSMATASLGVVCILMGKFKLADAVGYLPLPVVGGYLACKMIKRYARVA